MRGTQPALPLAVQLGWATGEVGVAVYIGTTMVFMLYFLTQAAAIPPVTAGLILLVPRIWDALIDPVIGTISDRTRSRMGRRRPYVIAGTLLLGPLFAAMFTVPADLSVTAKTLYLAATYLAASTAYSLFDVPYSAMAAEMTTSYAERTVLVSYKEIAARIGIMAALFGTPAILALRPNLGAGFRLLGALGALLIVGTFLVTLWTTRAAPAQPASTEAFDLRSELQVVLRNRPFRVLWLVFLLQNLAIGASATALVYLLTFVMHADVRMTGPLLAASSVVGIFVTPLWALVSRRTGKRGAYYLSLLLATAMALPALFLPPGYFVALFGMLLIAGVGDAGTQLFSGSMVPDTVEVEEQRSGRRREGAIFGAWIFCRKLGMAGGAFLVSVGLSLSGFVGGDTAGAVQSARALSGIRILYGLLPAALYLLAMLVLTRYDLSQERHDALRTELARARADH